MNITSTVTCSNRIALIELRSLEKMRPLHEKTNSLCASPSTERQQHRCNRNGVSRMGCQPPSQCFANTKEHLSCRTHHSALGRRTPEKQRQDAAYKPEHNSRKIMKIIVVASDSFPDKASISRLTDSTNSSKLC